MSDSPVVCFEGGWILSRVCPKCGKFVKVDETVGFNEYGIKNVENATCKKCGRVKVDVVEGGNV